MRPKSHRWTRRTSPPAMRRAIPGSLVPGSRRYTRRGEPRRLAFPRPGRHPQIRLSEVRRDEAASVGPKAVACGRDARRSRRPRRVRAAVRRGVDEGRGRPHAHAQLHLQALVGAPGRSHRRVLDRRGRDDVERRAERHRPDAGHDLRSGEDDHADGDLPSLHGRLQEPAAAGRLRPRRSGDPGAGGRHDHRPLQELRSQQPALHALPRRALRRRARTARTSRTSPGRAPT